jgi:TRAP-type uncharacterized transport system substrate-binding protein
MKRIVAMALAFAMAYGAQAQQIKVATGAQKGTYATMFKELNGVCANDVPMLETNTNGSNSNIDLLVGNQVNAAFTQTDVLYFRARTEDLGNVKTLVALHPEEVHIVALAQGLKKEGGTLGFGSKAPVLTQIGDLNGRVVGAAGGSYTTAQVIRLQSEVNFTVQQYDDNDKLMAALNKGEVDAALMVGGAPLPVVNALTPAHRLVAIPDAVQQKLKAVYRPARLSYNKMGAAGVATVATDAIFVTREYKTAKMTDALGRFRACALSKIDELKETTGTHPKWQAVDVANKGKWAYYELPGSTAAAKKK